MTPAETLYRLRSLGLEVAARDGRVAVRPAGRVPEDLRQAIRDGEAEVLRLLENPPRTPAEFLRFAKDVFGGEEFKGDTSGLDDPDRPLYAAWWPIGKYKGQPIHEAPTDYLLWALFEMEGLSKFHLRVIEAHLGCGGDA